ncbi:hypothetical protein CVT24_010717 [Panaeolus cyanescens]|uniref:HAT C-terminal dimerisation domain-containing protein n=1 Tax=Panaeolus cyanescens TaxID=181874 RepID=A0A409YVW6_9AGAR|nr:hypothetical protein CVT24_010717 [Panaeolus cyanescens]
MPQSPEDILWLNECFQEHPNANDVPKVAAAFADASMTRKKAFCLACWPAEYNIEVELDTVHIREGKRTNRRDDGMINATLWSGHTKEPGNRWTTSRPESKLRHFKGCERAHAKWPSFIRYLEPAMRARNLIMSPSKTKQIHYSSTPSTNPIPAPQLAPSHFEQLQTHAGVSVSPSPVPSIPGSPSPFHQPSPLQFAGDLTGPFFGPSNHAAAPGSSALFSSSSSYQHPSPSLPSPLSFSSPVIPSPSNKRARTTSTHNLSRKTSHHYLPTWTSDMQQRLGNRLARLTASAGFPYRWIENVEWTHFMTEFLPGALPISRRQLSDTLIPKEAERYRIESKKRAEGCLATLQCDGWSGINFHHFLAFMITTDRREVFSVKVFDTSSERKTADNLLRDIKVVMEILFREWKVEVIAITSDASGESRKARLDYGLEHPAIITPDCWAHQNALVVGDYFRASERDENQYLQAAESANQLITWVRSKTQVIALLKDVQQSLGRVVSVIRPVATRWTAYFMAYKRLLELKTSLCLLVDKKRDRLLVGKTSAQQKATEMIALIQNSLFWHKLEHVKMHLEPLARSSNILQASHARLDQVPLIFGGLLSEYEDMASKHPSDQGLIDVMTASLERRWKNSDQHIYIAAIMLHPLIKTSAFTKDSPWTNPGHIWTLMTRLWSRFYGEEAPISLIDEVNDYLEGKGKYQFLVGYSEAIQTAAESNGKVADPIEMWKGVRSHSDMLPLYRLAHRIFSVCCNSASCERLFSLYGSILTKHRSRLQSKKMNDTAELRMHMRDEHTRNHSETLPKRLKRKLTSHHATHSTVSTTPVVITPITSGHQGGGTTPQEPGDSTAAPAASIQNSTDPLTDDSDSDSASESDENDMWTEPIRTSRRISRLNQKLRDVIGRLRDASAVAEDEDLNTGSPAPPTAFPSVPTASRASRTNLELPISTSLTDLFDFSLPYWRSVREAATMNTLEAEMELHELLDLDAEGEFDDYEETNDMSHPTNSM